MPALEAPPICIDTGRKGITGPVSLATRRTRAGGVDDMTRFEALSKVIGHWIRNAHFSQALPVM